MWEVRVSPFGDFDNHAREYRHIKVAPLAAAMGAEVQGIRLPDLSDEALAEFKDALWRHKMLYLRDQQLTHAEHEAFSTRLGPFAVDAYTQGVEGHRDVHPIIKEADVSAKALFGGGWHTDSPFLETPPSVTILNAVDVPPFGGDTIWANCALAFRMLSPAYQEMLRPLKVHMSARNNFLTKQRLMGKPMTAELMERFGSAFEGRFAPMVHRHPETGEESLYVDESYSIGIEGMNTFEAKPILDFLFSHISQHAFTCRLRWEKGTVAMWDNRSSLHLGPNDYDGYRREMYRTTVAGIPTTPG